MRKISLSFVLLFLLAGIFGAMAQPVKVTSATPEVAEFTKYLTTPVDISTGVPDIRIPLMNFKSGEINIPIELSYHYTGSKVNEKSTWVGLGWNLNCEFDLSLTVNGGADGGYFTELPTQRPNKNILRLLANNQIDGQPDEYQFKLLKSRGKFYEKIYPNGTSKFFTVPYVGIKIERRGQSFQITDVDGTVYIYNGLVEETGTSSFTLSTRNWKCTQIISPSKTEVIDFEYYEPCYTRKYILNDRIEVYDDPRFLTQGSRRGRVELITNDMHRGGTYTLSAKSNSFEECFDNFQLSKGNYSLRQLITGSRKLKKISSRSGSVNFSFNFFS